MSITKDIKGLLYLMKFLRDMGLFNKNDYILWKFFYCNNSFSLSISKLSDGIFIKNYVASK